MLHKIILNIAAAGQFTTICAVIVLFSHISTCKVELYINHNFREMIFEFSTEDWILEWVVAFCGVELSGQIQCLNFNK